MTLQPTDPVTFSAGSSSTSSSEKTAAPAFLDLLIGPAWPACQTRRLLPLYLVSDGIAAGCVMNGLFGAALLAVALSRAVAFVLSRFTAKNSPSRRRTQASHSPWLACGLYLFTLATILLANAGRAFSERLSGFPAATGWRGTAAAWIDAMVAYLTVQGDGFFRLVTKGLLSLLKGLEAALVLTPWPVLFALVGYAAWRRGGAALLAVVWVALGYIGLLGYWSEALQTSALVLASLCVCIVFGIPLGILLAKSPASRAIVSPILDLMQTMPSFVYLLPAVAFFSIGKPPALIATVIFAVPPLIRLTCLGIEQVPLHVREAMQAHGATPMQTLLKAELPLALPSIRTGINQTIMMCLSMVVIAALIGGGGLGYNVLFALQNVQYGEGILAGLAIVFCAVLFDRLAGSARKSDS